MKSPIAIVALASCLTAACRTERPPPVPANLLACGKVQDSDARVRCYDTQIAAMNRSATAAPASAGAAANVPTPAPAAATPAPAAAAPVPAVTTPAPASETAAASTAAAPEASAVPAPAPSSQTAASQRALVKEFGEEQLPPSEQPPNPRLKEVLHSSITGIVQASPNNFVISLSNGQAWVENDAELTRLFHIGDDVQIERGTLGGYHLSARSTGAKNWVLVTRVR